MADCEWERNRNPETGGFRISQTLQFYIFDLLVDVLLSIFDPFVTEYTPLILDYLVDFPPDSLEHSQLSFSFPIVEFYVYTCEFLLVA